MSKIILGIKDDHRPMHILAFDGRYSIESKWDDPSAYGVRESKIILEANGEGIDFASFKGALNYIYGGRSEYQRELTALSVLEKSLGTKKNNFRINYHIFGISKVISNEPATIVFWKDGTKTVVKCQEGDTYDLEKGILYAIIRKVYGEGREYTNILNIIDESCETYDHTKANKAFWNHEKIDDRATNFLNDLEKLCYKYDISISHEDSQGAFILEPYAERNIERLRDAKK